MEENRKYPRCILHWRCALVVGDKGGQETIHCKSYDISIAGVSLLCHRNISAPNPAKVYLLVDPGDDLHPQSIVEVQGNIVNSVFSGELGGFRLGIQFTKFAGDSKQLLQKHLPKEFVKPARISKPLQQAPAAELKPEGAATPVTQETRAETAPNPAPEANPDAAEAPAPDALSERAKPE